VYGERPFFDPENSETLAQRKERLAKEREYIASHRRLRGLF
jgi:hypothetical protein